MYIRVVAGVAYVYNRVVADVPYVYNRVVAGVAYVYNRVVADVPYVYNRVVAGIIPQNSMASSSGLRLISHGLTITYSTRVLRYATHHRHTYSVYGVRCRLHRRLTSTLTTRQLPHCCRE